MLPLALVVQTTGVEVSGSDRALDQGRTAQKFDFLRARGIPLFPQDGSGITHSDLVVVTSAAVEESVPDVKAARALGARLVTLAELVDEQVCVGFRCVGEKVVVGSRKDVVDAAPAGPHQKRAPS